MSKRIIAFSSLKRASAKVFANSVFPVPVGPKKKKEPIGCSGLFIPLRDSRMASVTERIALSCPTTRWRKISSILSNRSFSSARIFPIGIPVFMETTAAICSSVMHCIFSLEKASSCSANWESKSKSLSAPIEVSASGIPSNCI